MMAEIGIAMIGVAAAFIIGMVVGTLIRRRRRRTTLTLGNARQFDKGNILDLGDGGQVQITKVLDASTVQVRRYRRHWWQRR